MNDFKTLRQEPFLKIIRLLDDKAFFVGGCVRDVLAGISVGDVDMATSLAPKEVMERFQKAGYHVIPTGVKHGTVTVVLPTRETIEITTFRKDVKTDGRHADVQFLSSMKEDAFRRDLTINALYLDANGKLYDFCGGVCDLKKKRVRFIGNATQRIQEDALRMLRFFRFWGTFGDDLPDKQAMKACRQCRFLLKNLSKERQRDELLKILSLPRVMDVLRQMQKAHILKMLIPTSSTALFQLQKLVSRERFLGVPFNPLLHLWVLSGTSTDLKLSNNQKAFLKKMSLSVQYPFKTQNDLLTVLYLFGPDVFSANLLVRKKKLSFGTWLFYKQLKMPVFPITAKDIQEKEGLSGKELGQKLKMYEQKWMFLGFPDEKKVVFSSKKE